VLAKGSSAWEASVRRGFDESTSTDVPPSRPAQSLPRPFSSGETNAEKKLRVLQGFLADAVRLRDPVDKIERLRQEIAYAKLEVEDESRPTAMNRGLDHEVTSAQRDLARGRLTRGDIVNRVEHYRSILVDTLANDPDAQARIRKLVGRIKGLEGLVRRLRHRRVS